MKRFSNPFSKVLLPNPQRSKFDLSHERKMTIPFGALIPTMVQEVLPGDSFQVTQDVLARFQALLSPVMHRVNVFTHFFYVRYGLVNEGFARFINYQGNRPNLTTNVTEAPYFQLDDARTADVFGVGNALKDGSLLDYLAFPTAPNDATLAAAGAAWYDQLRIPAWMPLAYQRIWNDFYRDQNFTQPLFRDGTENVPTSTILFEGLTRFNNGTIYDPETTSTALTSNYIKELLKLRWRAWEKDYLTTAAPYANQGIGDPRIPITIPAGALGNTPAVGAPVPATASTFGKTGGIPSASIPPVAGNPTDLGSFTTTALRYASALKRWLENSVRGGLRYPEMLWHRWKVKSSDARNWSAEYLGGGWQPMVISEVLSQAPASSTQNVPPGYMAGHGISYGSSMRFTRRFEEHGAIMAITSIIPRTGYLYSMPRYFMRTEPLDFAQPEFAHLGEQAVLGSEVMFKLNTTLASVSAPNYTTTAMTQSYGGVIQRAPMGYTGALYYGFDLQNDNPEASVTGNAWGFQSRFGEYRYAPDTVHGLMRNNQSFWHFGRMLSPNAALNNAFVQSNPRMDNFAILPSNGGAAGQYNQHPIYLNIMNNVSVIRSLPKYNKPSLF